MTRQVTRVQNRTQWTISQSAHMALRRMVDEARADGSGYVVLKVTRRAAPKDYANVIGCRGEVIQRTKDGGAWLCAVRISADDLERKMEKMLIVEGA